MKLRISKKEKLNEELKNEMVVIEKKTNECVTPEQLFNSMDLVYDFEKKYTSWSGRKKRRYKETYFTAMSYVEHKKINISRRLERSVAQLEYFTKEKIKYN